jgi:hypothetical protein
MIVYNFDVSNGINRKISVETKEGNLIINSEGNSQRLFLALTGAQVYSD